MKILVIFASHRIGGKNEEIEKAMKEYENHFEFDFVHLANNKVESCNSCHSCGRVGHCILPVTENDRFVMKNYRFDHTTYNYLNQEANPKEKYNNITDYVIDTLKMLISDNEG